MTEKEDNLNASADWYSQSENYIDDQEYMRTVHGRHVSEVIDDWNESSTNDDNENCEITLLPRLQIDSQLLVPIATCFRLIAFQQTIDQKEQKEKIKRTSIRSSVLTEIELFLRSEIKWWLDKNTGTVSGKRGLVKKSTGEEGNIEELDATLRRNDFGGKFDAKDSPKYEPDKKIDDKAKDKSEKQDSYTMEDEYNMLIGIIRERYKNTETPETLAEDYRLPVQKIFSYVGDIVRNDTTKKKNKKAGRRGKVRKSTWDKSKKRMLWYYE